MAKAKPKPPRAGAAVADQLERQRIATLVRSAEQKLRGGGTPNSRELSALKKFEREQLDRWGQHYLGAMPKGDYARVSGRQPKQLIDAADRYGFPYKPGDQSVDVGRILRWFHDFLAANGAVAAAPDGEDAILHLASKELKDEFVRQRIEEKKLDVEKKKIENATLLESFVPIEPIRQCHNRQADRIRASRMKFAKRFDGEIREFFEQEFDDLIKDFESFSEAMFSDSGAIDGDPTGPVEAGSAP